MATLKLEEITSQYSMFVTDQVLTADQLNEIVNYFEDQNRLTRICLSGVGIVCGLVVSTNLTNNTISISKGGGITTDGDLLKFEGKTYTHFKEFTDQDASYDRFSQINMVELSTAGDTANQGTIGSLTGWSSMVAVLYFENYSKDPTACSSTDCNNLGEKQIANIRVLLISAQHAQLISQYSVDPVFAKHNTTKYFVDLPDIDIQRVILRNRYKTNNSGEIVISEESNTVSYINLMKSYFNTFIETGLVDKLRIAFLSILNNFKLLLDTDSIGINTGLLYQYFENRFEVIDNHIPFDFQYRYDLLKDLIDTYTEIKGLLFDLTYVCCPETTSFPKHLILGEVVKTTHYYNYRHKFYPSQIVSNGYDVWKQIRSLIKRFYLLLEEYTIPNPKSAEIKITPSVIPDKVLGLRSVPYYYTVSNKLIIHWDYLKTKIFDSRKNLSYHTTNLLQTDFVLNPLKYNIDKKDFYRIEGHLGKNYKYALEEIIKLKTEYSLPFDVKVLSIGLPDIDLDINDYKCEFKDLAFLLEAWRTEQESVLSKAASFFSGFSVKEAGNNVTEKIVSIIPSSTRSRTVTSSNIKVEDSNTLSKAMASSDNRFGSIPLFANIRQKIVTENLTIEEGSLGNIIKTAFEEYKEGSVHDIIARAKELVNPNIADDVWDNEDKKDLFIEKSIEVLAYAHVFNRTSPDSLFDLQEDNISIYKSNIKKFCDLVKKLKSSYQKIDLGTNLKAQSTLLINQLSNICSSASKIEVLQDEIVKRKKTILLQMQLSKFVESNTGLEHKAGCGPGETFFMVYLNNDLTFGSAKKEGIFEIVDDLTGTSKKVSKESVLSIDITKKTDLKLKKEFGEMAKLYLRDSEILAQTVIADFTLPFICCSKCLCVNYIFPELPEFLKLEKNMVCLGKELVTVNFEVSPANGKVEPVEPVKGLKIDGQKILISPDDFPDEQIDKPIYFLLNGQATTEELKVGKIPVFDFAVPIKPTTQVEFTFKPKGKYLEAASFYWEFGDGNISEIKEPTHKYNISELEEKTVTVSLRVISKNGICKNKVEHRIIFIEKITISLPDEPVCDNFEDPLVFEIIPEDAMLVITGPGVKAGDNGGYIFIAAVAGAGTHSFLVNGNPSDYTFTVHPSPTAKFSWEQKENQLIFTGDSANVLKSIWKINDKIYKREGNKPVVFELKPDGSHIWKVVLTAQNEHCTDSTQKETIKTTYFEEEITIGLPNGPYCEKMDTPVAFTIDPPDAVIKITGKGVDNINGKYVFIASEAGVGTHTFDVNGKSSGCSVTVHKSPTAIFEAYQEGNELILINQSENATKYIWEINGTVVKKVKYPEHSIEIKPDSPAEARLRLTAENDFCKDISKIVPVKIKYKPEKTCIDKTLELIVDDGQALRKTKNGLQNNDSLLTEIYNPTVNYFNSVINNSNEILNGKLNSGLTNFNKLISTTAMYITEWQGQFDNPVYQSLVQVFKLQVKLVFNILRCQPASQIKKDNAIITPIVENLVNLIVKLKKIKVQLNEDGAIKEFFSQLAEATSDSAILNGHIKKMLKLFE
ncbi:MAG: PKD domain-containing protein [Mariniphaga sp.]|nr:PKD domain-containing protein [Mariniphaga sp.]